MGLGKSVDEVFHPKFQHPVVRMRLSYKAACVSPVLNAWNTSARKDVLTVLLRM